MPNPVDALKNVVHRALGRRGLLVMRPGAPRYADFAPELQAMIRELKPYTMTTPERIEALCSSVEYLQRAKVPGAIVECGVWKGGSMMAVAKTLMRLGDRDRDLFMYDTFTGMTAPSASDVDWAGRSEYELHRQGKSIADDVFEDFSEEVRNNLAMTGYPMERVRLIKGAVEKTLPSEVPEKVALLRLDTDFYESTRHELVHLYPRLSPGGVLIVDDYGHYTGSQRAVDEYFKERPVMLHRIDYSGRIAVRTLNA